MLCGKLALAASIFVVEELIYYRRAAQKSSRSIAAPILASVTQSQDYTIPETPCRLPPRFAQKFALAAPFKHRPAPPIQHITAMQRTPDLSSTSSEYRAPGVFPPLTSLQGRLNGRRLNLPLYNGEDDEDDVCLEPSWKLCVLSMDILERTNTAILSPD